MTTTCRIEGCRKRRHGQHALCAMHRSRIYRHGDPHAVRTRRAGSYEYAAAHGHPLRRADRVSVGRLVLWERIGPGVHPCAWCDRPLEWGKSLRAARVNGDRADSSPENLVPACAGCILRRSRRVTTRGGTGMKEHDVPTPQASSQLQSATSSDPA